MFKKKTKVIPQGLFPQGAPDVDWNNSDHIYVKHLNGEKVSIKSILQGQKTVLVFLRKFDCTTCYSYAILFSHLKPVLSLANIRIVFFTCHSDLREIKMFIETFGFWLRKISKDKLIQPLPGELYLDPDRIAYQFFGLCSQITLMSSLKIMYNVKFAQIFGRYPRSNGGKNVPFYRIADLMLNKMNWQFRKSSFERTSPLWQSPGICVVENNKLLYRYVLTDQTKIIPESPEKFLKDAFGIKNKDLFPTNNLDAIFDKFMETVDNKSTSAQVQDCEIILGDILGEGLESKVVKGEWLGHQVAVKYFRHDKSHIGNINHSRNFANETSILMSLSHKNIIKFMGFGIQDDFYYIIMQFMPRGSLFDVLGEDMNLDKHKIASEIVEGMIYLHNGKPPIAHSDIKSLNILLDEDFTIKISDFGFSKDHQLFSELEKKPDGDNSGITIHWAAPELLTKGNEPTLQTDVFSFGVVLWEIATQRRPWKGVKKEDIISKVLNGQRPEIRSGKNGNENSDNWNHKFDHLLQKCWHQNPKKRPTFKTIQKLLKNVEIPAIIQ